MLDFSYLSAIWPAIPEIKKNGKMKMPAVIATKDFVSEVLDSGILNVTNTMIANLKTLSFSAPKNWVAKRGANRRFVNSLNWLMSF